jgi:segregation and condensation protein A
VNSRDGRDRFTSSRALLPRPIRQEDPERIARGLIRRLLEHQKFKAAAGLRTKSSGRAVAPAGGPAGGWRPPEVEIEVDLFSLMSASVRCSGARGPAGAAARRTDPIGVDRSAAGARRRPGVRLRGLFADVQTRAGMIVTFLALLEMIRLRLVRVFQQGSFGPIRVYKREPPDPLTP